MRRKLGFLVSARLGHKKDCALPISNLRLPVSTATKTNNRFKELFDIRGPVFDPFGLSTNGKDTTCPFPFGRSNLVGPHTFGEPDGSGRRDIFGQAVVQQYFPPDTVRNCPTQSSQRN